MNKIGARMRNLREKNGFSQESIAMELSITQPSYARLEKDDNRINIVRLIQIAILLKTTVAELIDEKSQIPNERKEEETKAYTDNVIQANKEHISTLRNEINFLRKLTEQQFEVG